MMVWPCLVMVLGEVVTFGFSESDIFIEELRLKRET